MIHECVTIAIELWETFSVVKFYINKTIYYLYKVLYIRLYEYLHGSKEKVPGMSNLNSNFIS